MPAGLTVRLIPFEIRLVGRTPDDYAQELQEDINALVDQATGGVPSGFNHLTPLTIVLNEQADPGNEADGWMSATARFALDLLLRSKGELLSYDGAKYVPIPGPTAPGQVLASDPSAPGGVGWSASAGGVNPAAIRAYVSLRVG